MEIKDFKKEEEKLNHILIKYDEVMKYYKNRINSIFTTYANHILQDWISKEMEKLILKNYTSEK